MTNAAERERQLQVTQGKKLRNFPLYAVIPVLVAIIFHFVVYDIALDLAIPGLNFASFFTSPLDALIPVIPVWAIIYLADYPFVLIVSLLAGYSGKKQFYTFIASFTLVHIVALFFFIFMPVLGPERALSNDFFSPVLSFVYTIDPIPLNCVPSLHCGLTLLCYLGIRGARRIPKWVRVFSAVFLVLTCFATLFCRQHYIADIVLGLLIAGFLFWTCAEFNWYKPFEKFFSWLNKWTVGKLFPKYMAENNAIYSTHI